MVLFENNLFPHWLVSARLKVILGIRTGITLSRISLLILSYLLSKDLELAVS